MKRFREWRLDKIRRMAQWYADLIYRNLKSARSEREFLFWLEKGYQLDGYMINKYEIYLD